MWDLSKQYSNKFSHLFHVCYEEGCGLPLKFISWQDGRKPRYNPRCLYGVDSFTVLICQIFMCPNKHFITGCDPRVLSAFPLEISIPFVLLHRTGITTQVYHTIFDMACQGMSFSNIESFFLWRCQERHTSASVMCHILYNMNLHPITEHPKAYISNDLIMEFFVTMFKKTKKFLQECMSSITSEYLSCDHTFKLPKHIGLRRKMTG